MTRTHQIVLQTPEGISFPLQMASPVARSLALSIDFMIVAGIISAISKIMALLSLFQKDLFSSITIILYFIISIGYGILLEWIWKGQTVGKKIFRLRVVDIHGLRLTPSQIIMRNLLRFIDALPFLYLVGGITSFLNGRSQRLGDIASNTLVIRNPIPVVPDLTQIAFGKYNSFQNYPHLVARLRQRLTAEEAGAALNAVMRRSELEAEHRIELFKEIADYFKQIVPFPQEATEGISDEQYVRNLVDLLFRGRNT